MLKIPPDETFLYQIALFFVIWILLKRFWFTPMLHVLKERSARSAGAIAEAQKIQTEVEKVRQEHAVALEQTRTEAQTEVASILREADGEQRRVIDEATAAAQATLTDARAKIASDIAAARADLESQVTGIARQVASAALGRTV